MAKVLYKINRKQTGEPTAEEKWHDEMALKHYLKYCTSEKCIRGPEHQKKANWHEGFCLECVFNPYNMEDEETPSDWTKNKACRDAVLKTFGGES